MPQQAVVRCDLPRGIRAVATRGLPDGFTPLLAPLALVTAFCIRRLSRADLGWELHATAQGVLGARGGARLSAALLAATRLGVGCFIAWSTHWKVLSAGATVRLSTAHGATLPLTGALAMCTFTMWCWNLQGLYFLATGSLGLARLLLGAEMFDPLLPQGVYKALWLLFEQGFCCSLLVFFVVWLVLIPVTGLIKNPVQRRQMVSSFYTWFTLSAHNLNVVFMLGELLANELTFHQQHRWFIVLFSVAYVLFAWGLFLEHGLWFYFFLEPRQKPWSPLVYMGLMAVLLGFFQVGYTVSHALKPQME